MNTLTLDERVRVVSALVEGNSIRSTVRMTGVSKKTVMRVLCEVGEACWTYQQLNLKNLKCERIQCDEIWSFCYAKEKNLPVGLRNKHGFGSVWTWTALDPDSKLIASWFVGKRDTHAAYAFMKDLAGRLSNRIQLSTDGYRGYGEAIANAFGDNVDYGQVVKVYRATPGPDGKYSPGECCATVKTPMTGNPDEDHLSTSLVERQNLTMRMQMRRFTRLTNAFSKKIQNLQWAVALHFMWYNFCRIHQSIRCTPAMKAGVTKQVWEIEDIIRLAYPKAK